MPNLSVGLRFKNLDQLEEKLKQMKELAEEINELDVEAEIVMASDESEDDESVDDDYLNGYGMPVQNSDT
ncbi:hypothetical protein CFN03_08585 [Salinicoccus roseus]|uniref:Uncharacterized protein n=1 Tax=Salinicoccus roseus TaxID=45670 RepID=A0A265E6A8_9STAP|nr:hypothetical protein CFN03_08585 [Salinicoccus roseus]